MRKSYGQFSKLSVAATKFDRHFYSVLTKCSHEVRGGLGQYFCLTLPSPPKY